METVQKGKEVKSEMYCAKCREYVKMPHRCEVAGKSGTWSATFHADPCERPAFTYKEED